LVELIRKHGGPTSRDNGSARLAPSLARVAGPNGAGKTTITERGLAHEWFHDYEYINPDAIAQHELGDWNDTATVLRAAQLATERREACLREGRSLASYRVARGRNTAWTTAISGPIEVRVA
jgi:predicted ABC-type ATPase